jgi:RNA polymerase sigma-70 factor (ECF subfamily)
VAFSDTELAARALREDQEAFAELVRRYQSPLRAWLRRLAGGDEARADDLAQETFLRAYRRLGSFRGEGKFSAWLFAIAYNEFRNEIRRERGFVQLSDEVAEALIAPESGMPASDALADLDAGMRLLTVEQRAAITLCYQQGMTHEEAAAILKCPLGTLKTNIRRGKERLRRYLCSKPAPVN